ncbi:hypothetical protein [Pseudarthrobacter sp. H2]|uniref:hypothetical protein n=1 Tax=Pseudarthrobacter sp. H2 TaxID=3418415 RepID=UPI003CEACC8E
MPTDVGFRWERNGVGITGATAATYKLAAADKGAKITVRTLVKVYATGLPGVSIVSAPIGIG